MADVQEYAARLSQAIGPRPAGTEEEQQASFVIEEVLQQEATLDVSSEEFNCNPNYELPRIICCIITLVLALLSLFLPLMVVPSFVVCLLAAVIYILEVLGISPLGRTSKSGVSQNVIGKYIPAASGDQAPVARRRKVIVVAHYDTGRVRRELSGPLFSILNIIHWLELAGMVLVPVALLLRALTDAQDALLIFFNVLTVIGMVFAAMAVVSFVMHQTAAYNEGANCNAAGVAVMLEVAKRVGLGLYDMDEEEDVVVHGEEAAREAGVIPEGAVVEYAEGAAAASSGSTSAMDPLDLSAEISAAQAARSADTVAPISETISVAESASQAQPVAAVAQAEAAPVAQAAYAAPQPQSQLQPMPVAAAPVSAAPQADMNVPDWFKRAQAKANRASSDSTPVQRSRFADAIDGAAAAREAEAARVAQERTSAMDARLAEVHASIMNSPDAAKAHSAAQEAAMQAQAQAQAEAQAAAQAQQVAAAATEAAASQAQPVAQTQNGVDGFLASTTEAPDYQTAKEVDTDAPATSETKQTGAVADRLLSQPLPPRTSDDAAKKATAASAPAAAKRTTKTVKKEAKAAEPRRRRTIDLPSLTGAIEAVNSQSIPVDQDEAEDEPILKVITPEDKPTQTTVHAERQNFASSIPALDKKQSRASHAAVDDEQAEVVSVAGSFSVGGATGAFAPVGDELLADVDPDDMYVDDADDSDYDEGFTATGAMTSPSFVEMPKGRGMLSRFRRKKREDETSFAEAIGVDASFDARKVGRDRGGWESFRSTDDGWDDDDWNGGAFSRERLGAVVSKIKPGQREDGQAGSMRERGRRGSAGNEETPRTRFAGTDMDDSVDFAAAPDGQRNLHPFADIPLKGIGEDREAIREFHGGPINMEVWFVALGAELADNAGMKALLSEHAADLRGSMVIDLDGLGAGDLSLVEREGMYRPVKMSSRMKRYVRKAADSLGLSVGKGEMLWCNSAAYLAGRQGYQTLHLAGMSNGKPAYYAQADDVYDNLDELTLQDNADFVMDLIRAI